MCSLIQLGLALVDGLSLFLCFVFILDLLYSYPIHLLVLDLAATILAANNHAGRNVHHLYR